MRNIFKINSKKFAFSKFTFIFALLLYPHTLKIYG